MDFFLSFRSRRLLSPVKHPLQQSSRANAWRPKPSRARCYLQGLKTGFVWHRLESVALLNSLLPHQMGRGTRAAIRRPGCPIRPANLQGCTRPFACVGPQAVPLLLPTPCFGDDRRHEPRRIKVCCLKHSLGSLESHHAGNEVPTPKMTRHLSLGTELAEENWGHASQAHKVFLGSKKPE